MKASIIGLMMMCGITFAFGQDIVTTAEAESGTMTGVNVAENNGASGQKYVTGFDSPGDKLSVKVEIPAARFYKLIIRYRSASGLKVQDLLANEQFVANVSFPQSANFIDVDAGTLPLVKGTNTISIRHNWGYMDLDKFTIVTVAANVYNIAQTLIDPKATASTKALYEFLKINFGTHIISGQTDDHYDELKAVAGKSPMLRAFDLLTYCPQYPYNWQNGGHAFGAVPDGSPEKAIAWYNSTNKKGIVSFHWHWYSPSGGKVGSNTFSTENTVFDVRQAVISGTPENLDAIRDIDAIAVQLKKLSDANVPVIWRPLHEAGGKWFWWGAQGSAACKALWGIVYDRFTNHHGLHNLIWSWSTPEPDWYPGNEKVDMIGYDSYPGSYNYTTQKNVFDKLNVITGGTKIIAMTENGPVPQAQDCLDNDAPWSYFMSWSDLVLSQNSRQHLIDTFKYSRVLTLENPEGPGKPAVVTSVPDDSDVKVYPNPFRDSIRLSMDGAFSYTVFTASGKLVNSGKGDRSADIGQTWLVGSYILKIKRGQLEMTQKIVKTQ